MNCITATQKTDIQEIYQLVEFYASQYGPRHRSEVNLPKVPQRKTYLRDIMRTRRSFSTNNNNKIISGEKNMARRKKVDPNQISFLNTLDGTPELRVPEKPSGKPINNNKIKIAVSQAIKNSPFEREEIAQQISELAGREVSKAMLDAYTSQSRTTHNVPSDLLAPMTIVLGPSILRVIAESAGCTLAEREDMQLARIGQYFITVQSVKQQMDKEIHELPIFKGKIN